MTASPRRGAEVGAGLVGAVGGLLVVVSVLAFAVTWSTDAAFATTLDALGPDAVRRVAARTSGRGRPAAVEARIAAAELRLRAALRRWGRPVHLRWQVDRRWVELEVDVEAPRHGPSRLVGLGPVHRRFVAGVEAA